MESISLHFMEASIFFPIKKLFVVKQKLIDIFFLVRNVKTKWMKPINKNCCEKRNQVHLAINSIKHFLVGCFNKREISSIETLSHIPSNISHW